MMNGGVVPGGSVRNCTWLMAVTCGHRLADVYMRLEEDLDDADAHQRLRFDVLDVVDRGGHAALGVGDDAVGHLLGREAAVLPHHRHHRNIDVRKDIHGHGFNAENAQDQNQKREDDKSIRPPQRKPNNPHHTVGTRSPPAGPALVKQEAYHGPGHLALVWVIQALGALRSSNSIYHRSVVAVAHVYRDEYRPPPVRSQNQSC